MNIVQFLDEVGHTKLNFQLLHDCINGANQRRGYTEVKFGTTQIAPGDLIGEPRKVGIILWMDKAEYDRAVASMKAGSSK
jgi:hypothetical protein